MHWEDVRTRSTACAPVHTLCVYDELGGCVHGVGVCGACAQVCARTLLCEGSGACAQTCAGLATALRDGCSGQCVAAHAYSMRGNA